MDTLHHVKSDNCLVEFWTNLSPGSSILILTRGINCFSILVDRFLAGVMLSKRQYYLCLYSCGEVCILFEIRSSCHPASSLVFYDSIMKRDVVPFQPRRIC